MQEPDLSRATWRKSSRSNGSGGACVEVATIGSAVAVRDSKDPGGAKLLLTSRQWRALIRLAKNGGLDLA